MTDVVTLVGVVRRYVTRAETVVAVDDVSLAIRSGELVGVAGPSGSGKSTLLHLVLGWERPDAGSVRLDDSVRAAVGWAGIATVPQELGLLPELTGGQNVALASRLAGRPATDRVAEVVDALGIAALVDRLPAELSMGEQQRFAVARAVVAAPRLLVADEPTSHQDEGNADRVMEVLRGVADAGGAVLVATHDERLLAHAHRVVHLRDGRVHAVPDQVPS